MHTLTAQTTTEALIPAPLPNSLIDEPEMCAGDCGTEVTVSGNYCDACMDEYFCHYCKRTPTDDDLCQDCWEPDWIDPREDY